MSNHVSAYCGTWRVLPGGGMLQMFRLLFLGNGWADCVQIWYMGWGSLTKCLPNVMDGVHLHVRTCRCTTLFHKCSACCFSVTSGPIALKFGVHLGTY